MKKKVWAEGNRLFIGFSSSLFEDTYKTELDNPTEALLLREYVKKQSITRLMWLIAHDLLLNAFYAWIEYETTSPHDLKLQREVIGKCRR